MKIIFLLLVTLGLCSCAASVQTKLTAFGSIDTLPQGSVYIAATNPEFGETLEFDHYRNITASAVDAWQLAPVMEESQAKYKLSLGFDVVEVNPKDDGVQTALWLRTSPRMSLSSNVILYDQNDKKRQYQRSVNLVLRSMSDDKRLYEVTATSIGSCDVMTVVFDEMLEAIIKSFPLSSGSVKTVSVKGDSRC